MDGLERRHRISDPAQREVFEDQLLDTLQQAIHSVRRPLRTDTSSTPPRRVAIAMGLALQTAPHLSAVLPDPVRAGSVEPGEPPRRDDFPPLMKGNDALEEALGIPYWEIEELRDEIDRRAGVVLKQNRVASWLWSYFDLPDRDGADRLGRVLFPGVEQQGADVVRRGPNLYVLVDQPQPPPLAALWLPWLAPRRATSPTSFRSRGVDPGLRTRIARGIGADEEEVSGLLDGMICLVPREQASSFLHLDQWRSSGRAVMTDLGGAYTGGEWLARPLPPNGADWKSWLSADAQGRLALQGSASQIFDSLALPRVAHMATLLYAAALATVDSDGLGVGELRRRDLDLFDLPLHMRSVLQPLIDWAASPETHTTLAAALERPVRGVAAQLTRLGREWTDHTLRAWCGLPGTTKAPSIQTLLTEHLLASSYSLRELMRFEPDPRWEHTDLMLLFVAHYLREARLERLWIKPMSDVAEGHEGRLPPVEDIPGHWFWRTFLRLLE